MQEHELSKNCLFYDNRPIADLAADSILQDVIQVQLEYLYKQLGVTLFNVLHSSRSDLTFCKLVHAYKHKICRNKMITCGVYLTYKMGDALNPYMKYASCFVAPCERIRSNLTQEERAVNEADFLLLIHDQTREKPAVYHLARKKGIPIFLLNPLEIDYRIENRQYSDITLADLFCSIPITHSLKKQLKLLNRQLDSLFENAHLIRVTGILFGKESIWELEKQYNHAIVKIKREMRLVGLLVEYRDRGLTTLYWKVKEKIRMADRAFFKEFGQTKTPAGSAPAPSSETSNLIDESAKAAGLFVQKFNQKAQEQDSSFRIGRSNF